MQATQSPELGSARQLCFRCANLLTQAASWNANLNLCKRPIPRRWRVLGSLVSEARTNPGEHRLCGQRREHGLGARALEGDGVHRAEQRELRLELVRRDDRHELLARHRALELLAVEHLFLDLTPGALALRAREGLGALAVAPAEAPRTLR